jgi:hypothetical protein
MIITFYIHQHMALILCQSGTTCQDYDDDIAIGVTWKHARASAVHPMGSLSSTQLCGAGARLRLSAF